MGEGRADEVHKEMRGKIKSTQKGFKLAV